MGTRLIFSCVFLACLSCPAIAGMPAKLHTEGRWLKDATGKTVVLRGVNKPGYVDVPDGWWNKPGGSLFSGIGTWNPAAVGANLDEMRKWGNVIRFHTCIQWWKDNPSNYRDQYRDVNYPKPYREMLKDVIAWAGERGFYVILDFYNMKQGSDQEAMPWPPFADHRDVVADRDEFVRLWAGIGKELSGFPHVLFELYNEPHGDDKAEAEWFVFTQEAIDAIRAVSDGIIVVQWDYGCWANLDYPPPKNPASTMDWVEKHPLKGENILYSTHLYRTSGGGGGGMVHRTEGGMVSCWKRDDIVKALELTGVHRVALEKPLIVGELGANVRFKGEESHRELEWFGNLLSILNDWQVGYCGWAWDPEKHLMHGMLKDGNFFGGPNEAGKVFLRAVARRP